MNTGSFTDTEDYDGSYIVLDAKRFSFIRAGAAATGMMKRWKEHIQSSKRISDIEVEDMAILQLSFPSYAPTCHALLLLYNSSST